MKRDLIPETHLSEAPVTGSRSMARLNPAYPAVISDALLREFAADTLGAQRMSAQYLHALGIVLGNLFRAEHLGYYLELNIRTRFTTERTMRTILDQLAAAGITKAFRAITGHGRVQSVQRFMTRRMEPQEALNRYARLDEAEACRRLLANRSATPLADYSGIDAADVSH